MTYMRAWKVWEAEVSRCEECEWRWRRFSLSDVAHRPT